MTWLNVAQTYWLLPIDWTGPLTTYLSSNSFYSYNCNFHFLFSIQFQFILFFILFYFMSSLVVKVLKIFNLAVIQFFLLSFLLVGSNRGTTGMPSVMLGRNWGKRQTWQEILTSSTKNSTKSCLWARARSLDGWVSLEGTWSKWVLFKWQVLPKI